MIPVFPYGRSARYQCDVWWDDLLDSYVPTRERAYLIHLSHDDGMPNERLLRALVSREFSVSRPPIAPFR